MRAGRLPFIMRFTIAQLQARLRDAILPAVRAHLAEDGNAGNAHVVEAARQVAGDIFVKVDGDVLEVPARPQLLHEPYMSSSGASALLRHSLAGIAREADAEAKAQDILESDEFRSFQDLVRSVYVGSLQKRAEHAEKRAPLRNIPQARRDDSGVPAGATHEASGAERQCQPPDSVARGPSNATVWKVQPDSNRSSSSSDIAQTLVAMARGDGFARFTQPSATEIPGGALSTMHGGNSTTSAATSVATAGSSGLTGLANFAREIQTAEANVLRYLSADEPDVNSTSVLEESREYPRISGLARFPGLQWLAPYIVGRTIPMSLRRELWQRSLLESDGAAGSSPKEIERLVARLASEKGIVDPTITPIAGMIRTTVRHRAADAFPSLAYGGELTLEKRSRVCCGAERILNQYYVLVGRHEARHVGSALMLAYVFDQETAGERMRSSAPGHTSQRRGADEGAPLVAMHRSLACRCAPGADELRSLLRNRAYDEIQRRDPPLFDHLRSVFPAYKSGFGQVKSDEFPDAETEIGGKGRCGLVETWLEDALVGYLREGPLLFVWDHLFLLGWREQLPLFVADVALHVRATLIRVTAPLSLLGLAGDACRRMTTRDVRESFRRRSGGQVAAS